MAGSEDSGAGSNVGVAGSEVRGASSNVSEAGSERSERSEEAIVDFGDDGNDGIFDSGPANRAEKQASYKRKADWHAENLRLMAELNKWHSKEMERYDVLARRYSKHPGRIPESFRNRYFEIKPSPISGLGIFALQDIKRGATILIEKAILITSERTIYSDLEELSPANLESFFRLHAHYDGGIIDRSTAILRTNA